MLSLFLDTASNTHSLALCTEAKMLALESLPRETDTVLVPAIENILKTNGKTYGDLTRLACVTGPGGFTSLRVGIAAINALAYALKIHSAGIHLSELWSRRITTNAHDAGFLWLHSTRRTQTFMRKFDRTSEHPIELLDLDRAAALEGSYVGELLEEHRKLLVHCKPITDLMPLEEMLPEFLAKLNYGEAQILPWYGRGA